MKYPKEQKIIVTVIAAIAFMAILTSQPVSALNFDRVVDDKIGKTIPAPVCYQYADSIYYLGEQYGTLSEPADIFIDDRSNLLIADSGNNRVFRMSPEGEVLNVYAEAGGIAFAKPGGVFVTKAGDIYISDTDNKRIVVLKEDGSLVMEYVAPASELLGEGFVFSPGRLAVTSTGNMYVLKQQWLMSISKTGEFRGFIGVTRVSFDLGRFIRRLFMNSAQREIDLKQEPPSCLSFDLTDTDEVFVTTMDFTGGQLKKLNLLGDDIYPRKALFGEYLRNDLGVPVAETFIDVASDGMGNLFLLDQQFARVLVYDPLGNNLAVFSGPEFGKGKMGIPSAVDVAADGRVFVADQKLNEIMIFKPTNFMNLVFKASTAFADGDYENAVLHWNEVIRYDENYNLANVAIAKAYLKKDDFGNAIKYYRIADDKAGYSEAFSGKRHQIYKDNFFLVAFLVILAFFLTIFLLARYRKFSMKMLDEFMGGKGA
ncbi:MAG: hypothetical protein ACYC5K_07215 [Saccharofermentanales bacterium]